LMKCIYSRVKRDYRPVELMLFSLVSIPPAILAAAGDEKTAASSLLFILLVYIGYYGLAPTPRHANTILLALLFLAGEYGFLVRVPASVQVLPLVIIERTKVRSLGTVEGTMYPDIGQLMILAELARLIVKTRRCDNEDINTPKQA